MDTHTHTHTHTHRCGATQYILVLKPIVFFKRKLTARTSGLVWLHVARMFHRKWEDFWFDSDSMQSHVCSDIGIGWWMTGKFLVPGKSKLKQQEHYGTKQMELRSNKCTVSSNAQFCKNSRKVWNSDRKKKVTYSNSLYLRKANQCKLFCSHLFEVFVNNTNLTSLTFLYKISIEVLKNMKLPPVGLELSTLTITGLQVWCLSNCAK